jgi:helix-turn-helix protein
MKKGLGVKRGSRNVFRDVGHANADVEQLKTNLAAEIIKSLDRAGLSVRTAHDRTGIAASDFSRIAMRTSAVSLSTASCPSSTGSGRAWR